MADDVNLSQVAQDLPGLSGEKSFFFYATRMQTSSDVGLLLDT